jgi:hypothetical protein
MPHEILDAYPPVTSTHVLNKSPRHMTEQKQNHQKSEKQYFQGYRKILRNTSIVKIRTFILSFSFPWFVFLYLYLGTILLMFSR